MNINKNSAKHLYDICFCFCCGLKIIYFNSNGPKYILTVNNGIISVFLNEHFLFLYNWRVVDWHIGCLILLSLLHLQWTWFIYSIKLIIVIFFFRSEYFVLYFLQLYSTSEFFLCKKWSVQFFKFPRVQCLRKIRFISQVIIVSDFPSERGFRFIHV